MLAHDINNGFQKCPDCGNKLAKERDLFRCEEHGAFFSYGPKLLVRTPPQRAKLPDTLLPWENHSSQHN